MVIFEDEDVTIHLEERPGDTVLMAFGHLGMVGSNDFWAREVGEHLGWSVIGITPRRAHWYPPAGLIACQARLHAIAAAYPRRISYGASMGAYGAIKWARLIDATHTIAACPQASIDPADTAEFDQRFTHFFDPRRNQGMAVQTGDIVGRVYLLVDPWLKADIAHCRRIGALSDQVVTLTVPFMNHFAAVILGGSDILRNFVEVIVAGNDARAQRMLNRLRRGNVIRKLGVMMAAWFRRPELARRLYRTIRHSAPKTALAEAHWRFACEYERRAELKPALHHIGKARRLADAPVYEEADRRISRKVTEHREARMLV